MSVRAKPATNVISINANTIVGIASTVIGGVVLYMVTTGMGQVRATAIDVKEVKAALPFFQDSIKELKTDVREVQHEMKLSEHGK